MLRSRGTFQAALLVLSNARRSCHRPIARSRSLDLRGFLTRSTVDIQRAEQRGSRIVQLSPSLPRPCWANKLERARFRAERVRTCSLPFAFAHFPLSFSLSLSLSQSFSLTFAHVPRYSRFLHRYYLFRLPFSFFLTKLKADPDTSVPPRCCLTRMR